MTDAALDLSLAEISTASGRHVSLLKPDPASINVRDIASHLAKLCRFSGATSVFYSVAQHSEIVSTMMADHGPEGRAYGLFHDAHEAYLGDITRPVRHLLAVTAGLGMPWHPLEDTIGRLDAAIHAAVGLSWPPPAPIRAALRHADDRALATELRDLMPDGTDVSHLPVPWRSAVKPLPWVKAEERFLERYRELSVLLCLPGLAA